MFRNWWEFVQHCEVDNVTVAFHVSIFLSMIIFFSVLNYKSPKESSGYS